MKHLILIFAFIGLAFVSKAQTAPSYLKQMFSGSKTVDTVTNVADTAKFVFSAANIKNGSLAIRAVRMTGSPILTVVMQVSNDGLLWDMRQAALQVNGDTLNLVPVANGSKEKTLAIEATKNCYNFYRLIVYGHTGTSTSQVSSPLCSKRD